MPAFYGQSLLLVQMLAQERTPGNVLEFAEDVLSKGHVEALRDHYGFENWHALEEKWSAYLKAYRRGDRPSPIRSLPWSLPPLGVDAG